MSKPAAPQLVRALVDFYQGGQLLYKKDNLYPLDDRLQLLTARGEAQDYTPPAPVKAAQSGGKRNKAETATPPAAQLDGGSSDASNTEADSADSAKDSGLNEPEAKQEQAQQATEEVAKQTNSLHRLEHDRHHRH